MFSANGLKVKLAIRLMVISLHCNFCGRIGTLGQIYVFWYVSKMSKSQVFTTVYLILISSVFYVGNAHAQGTQVQFGQNRVQYKEFLWQFYESDHFKIYFNQGGQNIGRFVAQMAENDLDEIQDLLDYKLNVKPELMIYNTMSDFNQSNFAIGNEITYNIGGHTKIIGNKLFLYFDGDHQHLRTQIREGLGKMLISSMIFGGVCRRLFKMQCY